MASGRVQKTTQLDEGHLTRCTAASQLPSRSTAAHVGTSAARTAARISPVALVASIVVCQELTSAAVYSEVARHGNACRDYQTQGVIVLTALSRLADRWTHQHACGIRMLHLYGPSLQHLHSVAAAVSHIPQMQLTVEQSKASSIRRVFTPAAGPPPGLAWQGSAPLAASGGG